jgi:hypothetical protein
VPGGWVFTVENNTPGCFIPYDEEFMEKPDVRDMIK